MPGVTYSPFWGETQNAYSLLYNRAPAFDRVRGQVNRESFRVATALFNGLIGAASGSNVTATHKRIKYTDQFNGLGPFVSGKVDVETVTDINRNTAAADVTLLKSMTYDVSARPSTYPRDLSGNGGPSYT